MMPRLELKPVVDIVPSDLEKLCAWCAGET